MLREFAQLVAQLVRHGRGLGHLVQRTLDAILLRQLCQIIAHIVVTRLLFGRLDGGLLPLLAQLALCFTGLLHGRQPALADLAELLDRFPLLLLDLLPAASWLWISRRRWSASPAEGRGPFPVAGMPRYIDPATL